MSHPHPSAAALAANRRGIIAMSVAMASFIVNDTLIKYVSEGLPGTQSIFVRGLFATVMVLAVSQALGALKHWREFRHRALIIRAILDALATLVYLTALFHMPIANATAINMATPLLMTLMAVVWLGERVGSGRWMAIGAGFVGVLLVVQPRSDGFNAWALLCVGGTVLHALRDLYTRFVPASVPSVLVTVSTAVSVTLLSGTLTAIQGWEPVSGRQLALLAAAGAFLSGGYYLLVNSLRDGEMSVIAPFRYSGLLFALGLGYAIWGDVPNALAWSGIALLVAAGLYMLHHERQRQRAALEAASD